ncbi:MAG: gliding motility-associated C-terminal domain-containing protein [Flavobacteriales bacterium]
MKKLLLAIFVLFNTINLVASHIIGGDISVIGLGSNNFKIKANVYRDDINGLASMATSLTVGIYQIGTNNLVTTVNVPRTSLSIVTLGDLCYVPDPNSIKIEEGIFESSSFFLPNYVNGYYVHTQIYARNTLAINVNTSTEGMSFYCEIPNPVMGLNSNPQFTGYPADAYFCVNSSKTFNFEVVDPDGDSLVYSLVTPLGSSGTTNGTVPGTGVYPYYPSIPWNTGSGFNLSNIVGGATPMSINATTGDITASPSLQGVFTFAVRIEEFRNGVKIGETRRDVQYNSLNCTSGNPPTFLNSSPVMGETIPIMYNKLYCKDLVFNDINATDTLYIETISEIFDSGAYLPTITPDINGNHHYYYNYNGTSWSDSVVIPPNQFEASTGYYWNIGTVALRFCWTPSCNDLFKSFSVQVNAFSLGCDGKSQDSILFNLDVVPPPVNFSTLGDIMVPYGTDYCQDISFKDTSLVDLIKIDISSSIFSNGAVFPTLPNNYVYSDSIITNVPNTSSNTQALGSRYCWTPDCEHIGNVYGLRAILSSIDCPQAIQDTISFDITVTPPFDTLEFVPNVFTPNGDGMNDVFQISGISNPCNDNIALKIYNRWGIEIFESSDPIFEWDGKNKSGNEVPSGTYYLIVTGTFGSETIPIEKRIISLMR